MKVDSYVVLRGRTRLEINVTPLILLKVTNVTAIDRVTFFRLSDVTETPNTEQNVL